MGVTPLQQHSKHFQLHRIFLKIPYCKVYCLSAQRCRITHQHTILLTMKEVCSDLFGKTCLLVKIAQEMVEATRTRNGIQRREQQRRHGSQSTSKRKRLNKSLHSRKNGIEYLLLLFWHIHFPN